MRDRLKNKGTGYFRRRYFRRQVRVSVSRVSSDYSSRDTINLRAGGRRNKNLSLSPGSNLSEGKGARQAGDGTKPQRFRHIFTSSTTALRGTARRNIRLVG